MPHRSPLSHGVQVPQPLSEGCFLCPGMPSAPAGAQCGAFPAPDTTYRLPLSHGRSPRPPPGAVFCAQACPLPRRVSSVMLPGTRHLHCPPFPHGRSLHTVPNPRRGLFLSLHPGGFCPADPPARCRASLWVENVLSPGTGCPWAVFFPGRRHRLVTGRFITLTG